MREDCRGRRYLVATHGTREGVPTRPRHDHGLLRHREGQGRGVCSSGDRRALDRVRRSSPQRGRLRRAIALGWPDLEDGVCAAAAAAVGCDVIATRDPSGFPDSPVRVSDPATVLAWLVAE